MADVPESWEDVVDELEEPAPPPPPPKQKSSPTKAKPSPQSARKKFQEEEDFLDDPVAERLRRERLVEESEKRLVDDFFAGCERPDAPPTAKDTAEDSHKAHISARASKALAASTTDPMDAIHLKTYGDCERFVEALSKKILESPAKSPAWLRLLDLLLKECSPKMDLKDLKTLQGKLNSTVIAREKADRLLAEKKKKPNDLKTKCRNYEEEIDIVYGGGSEEEEEDYDDDVPDDGGDEFI